MIRGSTHSGRTFGRDLKSTMRPERLDYSISQPSSMSNCADEPLSIGLSAVIEETDGTKSYWALRHPPGPPDFHHPDCFALELPALAAP